jgi:hypothetical protein
LWCKPIHTSTTLGASFEEERVDDDGNWQVKMNMIFEKWNQW